MTYRNVIVACARWETDYISEWLSFHRSVGIDHAFIYCNDDDPRELYEVLLPFLTSASPFVTFHHFGLQGQQGQMYAHFVRNYLDRTTRFICLDVDEFILLRKQDTVPEFIEQFENSDAIMLYSVNAGHNGYAERKKGSAIRNYPRRSETVEPFTKAFVRAQSVDRSRLDQAVGSAWWHNSEAILKEGSLCTDVLGNSMRGFYANHEAAWLARTKDTGFGARVIDTAFIYHIGMKSEADVLRRVSRGTSGDFFLQASWKKHLEENPDFIKALFESYNLREETRLIELLDKSSNSSYLNQIAAKPPGPNIALFKPADQSSTCEWSHHSESVQDAAGLVNGKPRGLWSHHTASEDSPWWRVDLGEARGVSQIHIYGRVDHVRGRFRNFVLSGSVDGKSWEVLHAKIDDIAFGGVDGQMFKWKPESRLLVRFIKVSGVGHCCMDLDQVTVYA